MISTGSFWLAIFSYAIAARGPILDGDGLFALVPEASEAETSSECLLLSDGRDSFEQTLR
jgi:hypothetical protein